MRPSPHTPLPTTFSPHQPLPSCPLTLSAPSSSHTYPYLSVEDKNKSIAIHWRGRFSLYSQLLGRSIKGCGLYAFLSTRWTFWWFGRPNADIIYFLLSYPKSRLFSPDRYVSVGQKRSRQSSYAGQSQCWREISKVSFLRSYSSYWAEVMDSWLN